MNHHIYAFGSICRGEIDYASDVDLLACVGTSTSNKLDPRKFSIYTYDRIEQLWREGNPFAWHLHLESKLIFSSDGSDFLAELGSPSAYSGVADDCAKFHRLFIESDDSLARSSNSLVFHMSCLFLAARNFATCYSFVLGRPIFSRTSPLLIDRKLPISEENFDVFARARILSTRGQGRAITVAEFEKARSSSTVIRDWMEELYATVVQHE